LEIESGLAFPLCLNYEYIQKELIRVKSKLDPFTQDVEKLIRNGEFETVEFKAGSNRETIETDEVEQKSL